MQRPDLVTPPPAISQCNSTEEEEAGIRQISNFPINLLLMLMGAMPFGSISVCKLEADEEGEGERREREATLPLPLIGRLARVRGHQSRPPPLGILRESVQA